jgi:hypothetical protein
MLWGGWATPTGSNEPLYGRTDTKSPMVYSAMVHVAGGKNVRSAVTTTDIPPPQVASRFDDLAALEPKAS